METLTINKLGVEKTINYTNKKTNRPDSFQKVGFQSNEHPNQWYDFTYRGACPLQEGNKYEFEIASREYQGKTYYDARLPRKNGGGGNLQPVMDRLNMIYSEVVAIRTEMVMARQAKENPSTYPEDPNATPENIDASF